MTLGTCPSLADHGRVLILTVTALKREIGAMREDVVFTVIFRKDGKFLAAPTVLGEFGRELCVEIPELMRAQVLAMAPNQDGRSLTSAKMAIFQRNGWQCPKEMS